MRPTVPNPPGTKFHPHVGRYVSSTYFLLWISSIRILQMEFPHGQFPYPKHRKQYPSASPQKRSPIKTKPTFSEWCSQCSRYTPVSRSACEQLDVKGEVGMGKLYWSSICKCESWLQFPKQNFLNALSIHKPYPKPSTMHCQKHFAPPKKDTSPGMWTTRR